jgi:protein-S-isoprenylcysteine O-methyltransferase Ste14
MVPSMFGVRSKRESRPPEPVRPPGQPKGHLRPASSLRRWLEPDALSPRSERLLRIGANLVGASGAALFAWATLQFYLQTHRLIGGAFFVEQMWVVVAYLIRRPARKVSRRLGDWLVAFGGTFGGVLFRPVVDSPQWGVNAGLGLQLLGLSICVWSFLALGRSFGFVAADRGLVRRGPYAVVRHPIYASYFLLQSGYLLQSMSVRNAFVLLFVSSCNVGRALAEDRMLATNEHYDAYRRQVRWRLLPGVW